MQNGYTQKDRGKERKRKTEMSFFAYDLHLDKIKRNTKPEHNKCEMI